MSNDYRPRLTNKIRELLEQKINNQKLYKAAGYSSKLSFIDQAIKEKVEREKEKLQNQKETTETESNDINLNTNNPPWMDDK